MNPMEILLGKNRDQKTMKALSDGLRRRKEVAQLALLSGDPSASQFGGALYGDVEDKVSKRLTERDKAEQRNLTKSYYDQMASQNQATFGLAKARLAETERHNRATEANVFKKALKDTQTNTRNLARDLTKAGVPEISEGINLINAELAKYEDGDIPGMGGLANALPGMSGEARHIKSLVGRVRNIILKARSGGAVTPQEADRLLEEFSLGITNTDEDFKRAWADFQNVFSTGVSNIYAGYSPDVVDSYMQNLESQASSGVSQPSGKPEAPGTSWGSMDGTPPGAPSTGSKAVNWSDM